MNVRDAGGNLRKCIDIVAAGDSARCYPKGNSMTPIIYSGQEVIIDPATVDTVDIGDVVLCSVSGRVFLHLVSAKKNIKGKQLVTITNAKGFINGHTARVFGRVRN